MEVFLMVEILMRQKYFLWWRFPFDKHFLWWRFPFDKNSCCGDFHQTKIVPIMDVSITQVFPLMEISSRQKVLDLLLYVLVSWTLFCCGLDCFLMRFLVFVSLSVSLWNRHVAGVDGTPNFVFHLFHCSSISQRNRHCVSCLQKSTRAQNFFLSDNTWI